MQMIFIASSPHENPYHTHLCSARLSLFPLGARESETEARSKPHEPEPNENSWAGCCLFAASFCMFAPVLEEPFDTHMLTESGDNWALFGMIDPAVFGYPS